MIPNSAYLVFLQQLAKELLKQHKKEIAERNRIDQEAQQKAAQRKRDDKAAEKEARELAKAAKKRQAAEGPPKLAPGKVVF